MGITFDCPHCKVQRLAIFFSNPIDGLDTPFGVRYLWHRDGETFETLSVTPSIDAEFVGHWHGHIKNGEIV